MPRRVIFRRRQGSTFTLNSPIEQGQICTSLKRDIASITVAYVKCYIRKRLRNLVIYIIIDIDWKLTVYKERTYKLAKQG